MSEPDARVLTVPSLSLVVLVGASGAGKSTFAATHFGPYEVLSSDHYRGVVSNDPASQEASTDAFAALEHLVEVRLRRGLLTVIDATNVQPASRKRWITLARRYHALAVAIVLKTDPRTCLARNAERPDRDFGDHVVRRQYGALKRSVGGLRREGFRYVHVLKTPEEVAQVRIERPRPWTDRRDDTGPFDLIGDVHGCLSECVSLLSALGYDVAVSGEGFARRFTVTPPAGRRALFLGDLVDRGPDSPGVLSLVMDMVAQGAALCVPGNHDVKLLKWLRGRQVRLTHGLDRTVAQLDGAPDAYLARCAEFIDGLISHFVLDEGRLVVAHAGMRADLAGRASGKVRQFALYGETTGEIDEFGLPVRYPWAREYAGAASVVYGHTPVPSADWVGRTLCIDTGCVFGGALTALRWPERELVSVPAEAEHYPPMRPLAEATAPPAPEEDDGLLYIADVTGDQVVETRLRGRVRIPAERAAAALEVLSRFAADPRWLVHLPPTMSPPKASKRDGTLEHPDEAFAYFRSVGVREVVCEAKHMGSRAVVVACREPSAAEARFRLPGAVARGESGVVLTRRGRRFFSDRAQEQALLAEVRAAIGAAGLWEELETDWVVLDCELMPWSAKARALLEDQYAPVGTAGRLDLAATESALAAAVARCGDGQALLERVRWRRAAVQRYTESYRRYCWHTEGLEGVRLAPFHLLASEGAVHTDKDHTWHMQTLGRIVAAGGDRFTETAWRRVDLQDDAAVAEAVAWWEAYTGGGGEGMVVKPHAFLAYDGKGRLVQPAVKVRGREYLRIIYGPEYLDPPYLERLRSRNVKGKSNLALRELALGIEALERFARREPLRRVHQCVFGVLALEAEPMDPRL